MADQWPRHAQITATDRGPLVNIASWTLAVTTVLFTSFRLLSNTVLRGAVSKDDWIICVTTLLAIAQTIATSSMVKNGIGQHQDTLSGSTIARFQQSILAGSVLYVVTLAFSKFSLLFFLSRLISAETQKTFKLLMRATWAIMLLYLVSEVLILSFGCNLPRVYDFTGGRCIDLLAFWDFDAVFDVVSGLVILALPIVIVQPLQMAAGKKFQAISAFTFQIPACAFAIVRLVYLHRALDAQDSTWAAVDWQIWTAINMHFNVIAANIPCLKIFLDGFQSTLFRNGLATQVVSSNQTGYSKDHSRSNVAKASRDRSKQRSIHSNEERILADNGFAISELRPYEGETSAEVTTSSLTKPYVDEEARPGTVNDDQIRKTTVWSVLRNGEEQAHGHQA